MANKFYILISYGDYDNPWCTTSKENAIEEYKALIFEKINNFYRHKLPLKVDNEIIRHFEDLTLYEVSAEQVVKIDLQKEFDNSYQEGLEQEKYEKEHEWRRAQDLFKKYKKELLAIDNSSND